MRLGVAGRTNAVLDAPGYGRKNVKVVTLGYGMSVVSNEGAGRTKRAFYPFVVTSGTWYITMAFASVEERDEITGWLLFYIARITDPVLTPLNPITVQVPSRSFVKVGYPVSSLEFGEEFGVGVHLVQLQFASASDPTLTSTYASRYQPPLRDAAAARFYPAGNQDSSPAPSPGPVPTSTHGDEIWDGGGGSGGTPLRYR